MKRISLLLLVSLSDSPERLGCNQRIHRSGRRSLLCALAIALLPLFSTHATSSDAQTAPADMRIAQAVDLLASRSDADSLAAAALLGVAMNRDRSISLIEKATTSAPERPDLVWLQIQFCQAKPACDPEPMEERLRSLDVRNGADWIGSLTRADKANDEQAKSAALAAISRSERLDIYWTTLVARLSRATAKTKVVSITEAEISVIGILAAQAIPAYQVLSNACKGERLKRDDVFEVCRGIANALQNGDTYITEMIGVAIAKRVWPENSPQWIEATEARRSFEYRAKYLSQSDVWNAAYTDQYLTLCAQNRREQDVYKAELIASGENPDPPPN
jgi:hypothetical protein